jgi:small-conductance mechanosensitive channel
MLACIAALGSTLPAEDMARRGARSARQMPPAASAARPSAQQQQDPASRAQLERERTVATIRTLLDIRAQRAEEVRRLETRVREESDERAKLAAIEDLRAAEAELARVQRSLDATITGVDMDDYEGSEQSFDLEAEVKNLLAPLIEQLKQLTAEPRQIENLRSEVERHAVRAAVAERAVRNVATLREGVSDPALQAVLAEAERRWTERRNELRNLQAIARSQLDRRLSERQSLMESTRALFGDFVRTRGLNLLMAIAAGTVVLFGLRLLYRPIARAASRRGTSFYARLLAVLFHVLRLLFALIAALLVLYVAGDWVLLGLALVFLLGLAWAGKQALPRFVEEIRLLLNLGSVREQERLVLSGLPWRVDRLHLYTRLVNPALTGGELRIPIRSLIGLQSRPSAERESWFPCAEGDWVRLEDGTRGRVVLQSPEFVQLVKLGGARVTYQTGEFLAARPENLSVAFRVRSTFGVDYRHQPISTSSIPALMQERLQVGLAELAGKENVLNVGVEFKAAGSSSLDVEVLADFKGEVASRSEALERAVQRILVETCNQEGWVIPFTQVAVHQAAAATAAAAT